MYKPQIQSYLPPTPVELWIRYTTRNPQIPKPVSRAVKTRKTAPNASKTRQKYIPESINNDLWKVGVCNMRKPGSRSPERPNSVPEIDKKSDLETSLKRIGIQDSVPKKLSKTNPKITENPVREPLVSILLLPWSRGAKMDAPSPANDIHEELKGVCGRVPLKIWIG